GLVAKKAAALGLDSQPWVKPSLGPGSLVVTDYLKKTGLLHELEKVGFFIVGYGCTTCIGNSGPLPAEISKERSEEHTSELQSRLPARRSSDLRTGAEEGRRSRT